MNDTDHVYLVVVDVYQPVQRHHHVGDVVLGLLRQLDAAFQRNCLAVTEPVPHHRLTPRQAQHAGDEVVLEISHVHGRCYIIQMCADTSVLTLIDIRDGHPIAGDIRRGEVYILVLRVRLELK